MEEENGRGRKLPCMDNDGNLATSAGQDGHSSGLRKGELGPWSCGTLNSGLKEEIPRALSAGLPQSGVPGVSGSRVRTRMR